MTPHHPPHAIVGRLGATVPRRAHGVIPTAVFLALAAAALCASAAPGFVGTARADVSEQEAPPKKCVASEAVYFGDSREWTKPAELDADAVYRSIPEYKEIVDGKIEPADAKYDVLMAKARNRFLQAIRAVAKDAGYDLVARLGSVRGVDSVPNITQDVIAKL